jgi:hypothetical protein
MPPKDTHVPEVVLVPDRNFLTESQKGQDISVPYPAKRSFAVKLTRRGTSAAREDSWPTSDNRRFSTGRVGSILPGLEWPRICGQNRTSFKRNEIDTRHLPC